MWLATLGMAFAIGLAAVITSSSLSKWTYTLSLDFPAVKQALLDTGIGFDSLFQLVIWVITPLAALRTFFVIRDDKAKTTPEAAPASVSPEVPPTQPLNQLSLQSEAATYPSGRSMLRPSPEPLRDRERILDATRLRLIELSDKHYSGPRNLDSGNG